MALSPELLAKAMWSLAIDKVSAEVIGVFEAAGIDVLLVKGPVIAAWLYPHDVRHYGDGDLLVSPADWDRSVAVLEELGFPRLSRGARHPRMESQAGTGFIRGAESIDLHSTLPGLRATRRRSGKPLVHGADAAGRAGGPCACRTAPAC